MATPKWGPAYCREPGERRKPHRFPLGLPSKVAVGYCDASARRRVRWSCGAVWSARRPVKPEVAGSNPVRTATAERQRGRVAQLVERAPEKREVRGSIPRPTTPRKRLL